MNKFTSTLLVSAATVLLSASAWSAADPATAATVTCSDGTMGHAGKGACSSHGGIKKDGATAGATGTMHAKKHSDTASTSTAAAKMSATDPTGATAKCKDGTYSHSKKTTGLCSHHGGVGESMAK